MPFFFPPTYPELIPFDFYIVRRKFSGLYHKVRQCQPAGEHPGTNSIEQICSAVDLACIWYWKEAACLQRSAATACLLKRYGVPAQLIIGAQQMPFKAHAWVEVNRRVVNDRAYTPEMYAVLDRVG